MKVRKISGKRSTDTDFEFSRPQRGVQQRNPVTVALLFYVVTVGAILSACLRTLVGDDTLTGESLQRVVLIGIVVGLLSGGILGFYVIKGRLSAVVASSIGILVGAIAGGLSLVQSKYFYEITLIAFAGCWLLIVVMLLSARFGYSEGQ